MCVCSNQEKCQMMEVFDKDASTLVKGLNMLMLTLAKNVMDHLICFPARDTPNLQRLYRGTLCIKKLVNAIHWGVGGATGGICLLLALVRSRAERNSWRRRRRKWNRSCEINCSPVNVPSTGALLQHAVALSPPSLANDTSFSIKLAAFFSCLFNGCMLPLPEFPRWHKIDIWNESRLWPGFGHLAFFCLLSTVLHLLLAF